MKQHTAWLEAQIKSIPALASKTFVSVAPRDAQGKLPTAPYVVLHPSDGRNTQERVTGPRTTQHPRFTIHTVGSSYNNAATVAELVQAKLVVAGRGVVPSVVGERSFPAWYESPIPVQVDADVTPPLIYHVAECGWDSEPA